MNVEIPDILPTDVQTALADKFAQDILTELMKNYAKTVPSVTVFEFQAPARAIMGFSDAKIAKKVLKNCLQNNLYDAELSMTKPGTNTYVVVADKIATVNDLTVALTIP